MGEATALAETFVCANCHGTFAKVWSDEQAWAEADERWPGMPEDQLAVICDDCYRRFSSWLQGLGGGGYGIG